MRRIFAAFAVALCLAGCAGSQTTSIGDLIKLGTTGVQNPVSSTNIYQLQLAYAAALQVSVDYRNYCYSKSYEEILKDPVMRAVCEYRRRVLTQIQKYRPKAGSAVRSAEAFVFANPTVSAAGVLDDAWKAVTDFQNAVPRVPK